MQFLGVCILALAATLSSGYIVGNEYTYHVSGKLMHEFAKKTHQHAGYKFKSILTVQVKSPGTTVLRIHDSNSVLVNEVVDEDKEHELKPTPDIEDLTKPFEVIREHGLVKEIRVPKDTPLWAVNIKKTVAARLQMNFDKINLVEDHHKNHSGSHFDNKYYYTVYEDGIHGECAKDYIIDDSGHNEIDVIKTTDFTKCKQMAYRFHNNKNSDVCINCGRHIYSAMNYFDTIHYTLKGDRKNYVLEKLHAEDRFTYAPHGMEAEYITGDGELNMELHDVKPITTPLQVPSDAVAHHDLHFVFEEHDHEIKTVEDLKKTPYHFYHFVDDHTPLETTAELLMKISRIHDEEPYTEIYKAQPMPLLFMQLVNGIASLNYDELNELHDAHAITDGPDQPHRKRLFLNALIGAGTSSSFMYLKHLITEKTIPVYVIMFALGQLPPNIKHISEPLIEEFYTLCEHPKMHDNMYTRKICYLAFSRFVHERCVSQYHLIQNVFKTTEKPRCTPETAEKYFRKMVKSHEGHSKNSLERILCIKTAGNFGTRESLEYLRKIIHDDQLPNYFRFNAIWSIGSQTSIYPREVLSLMMPIYFNTSEAHEIRMAALIAIMSSDPELHQMQAIAENLADEPDHQVKHYTMTVIKATASAESPCYETLRGKARRVMRYLKRAGFKISYDLRHSFVKFLNGYDSKWKLGGSTFLNFITSNQSYVPQQLSFAMEDYKGLVVENPFEVGYTGYGLDKIFDRVIGLMKQRKSVLNLFKRKTRDVDIVEKELKEIDEKLHIDTRVPEPLFADLYMDVFGSEINFFHFNDSTFQSIIKHGGNYLGELLNKLKDVSKYTTKNYFLGHQVKFVTPSIVGVPIYLDITQGHFLYYRNNNFKLNISPNPLAEEKDDGTPTTINLKIDGHYVHDRVSFLTAGTILRKSKLITAAGVAKSLYKSIPLKLKMAIEPSTPKVVVKFTPIMPHTLVRRSFDPFTMLMSQKDMTGDISKAFLMYSPKDKMKQVEMDLFHDYLGYGLHLRGRFGKLNKLKNLGSFKKFLAETDLRQKIYYLLENPMAVAEAHEISLTPATADKTDEIDIVLNFDHFGYDTKSDKLYKPDFPIVQDGNENYINSRGDRKATTCVMKIERLSKGGKERNLAVELGYTHTFDNLYHRLDFHYDRSPFGPNEKDHFQICYSASMKFPHVDMKKLYELDTVQMDPKIHVAGDLHFGKNCENDKKLTARGELSRTEQHKEMQANREDPEQNCPYYNPDAYYYNKCKKDIEHGIHYDRSCRKYWYRSMKLRHYSIDYQHENFDKKDILALRKLDDCAKTMWFYYVNNHHNKVANDTHKFHIDADFSARSDHVDVTVRKPLETTEFTHVPHPNWIQARSASPFFEYTNKIRLWGFFKKPFCFVEGDNVRTFDDVSFKIPHIDCEKVIAKDCSHKELFTVLAKNIKHNRHTKAVKVFLKKWKIEALPVTEDSEIIVRLNGQAIPVTEAEPYFHYENLKGKDVLMFSVSFNGIQYVIRSEQLGVTVYYGGTAIVVSLNPYYRGKQCGLCGDFNNNDLDEFVGPRNCVYKNENDFAYSYAIPGDGCQVPAITAPCEHHHL